MAIGHDDGFLDVSVRDRGIGMSPRIESPGVGLGRLLMANLADRCAINLPAMAVPKSSYASRSPRADRASPAAALARLRMPRLTVYAQPFAEGLELEPVRGQPSDEGRLSSHRTLVDVDGVGRAAAT